MGIWCCFVWIYDVVVIWWCDSKKVFIVFVVVKLVFVVFVDEIEVVVVFVIVVVWLGWCVYDY